MGMLELACPPPSPILPFIPSVVHNVMNALSYLQRLDEHFSLSTLCLDSPLDSSQLQGMKKDPINSIGIMYKTHIGHIYICNYMLSK